MQWYGIDGTMVKTGTDVFSVLCVVFVEWWIKSTKSLFFLTFVAGGFVSCFLISINLKPAIKWSAQASSWHTPHRRPCAFHHLLHTLLMFRNCQDVGQGLGWGGACQRSLYVAHVVDVPQLPGCGAGAGVGWGMLTFLVRCTRCWFSAPARMWGRGWGGVGHVNVPCTLHTLLMFRNCQDVGQGWGGVGHVLQRSSKWKLCVTNANNLPARLLKKLPLVLVWQALKW